jgi:hypothetical protein
MSEDFGNSRFERAWETPEEVILRRELIRTPGLQPEDLGVLAELLLRDPWLPSTMEAIRKDLQTQGWKMGKDRYNAIAGRLTKAGHLARIPAYDEATQRPTWVTRVYRNPANNGQYVDLGITTSMQVGAEVRETRDSEPTPDAGSRETRVSPGQSRIAGNPRFGNPGFARSEPKPGKPAIRSVPPTPPGGGNYLLPLPPHRHHRSRAGCAGGGGGGGLRPQGNSSGGAAAPDASAAVVCGPAEGEGACPGAAGGDG